MKIDWDPEKNQINMKKHGVSFEEAAELFSIPDIQVLEVYDYKHSMDEDRFLSIGPIKRGIVVIVSTEIDDDLIRIISARFAVKHEELMYYSLIHGETDE